MHLFLNICLLPTYQLETLTHKGEIEKLSHPLLFFNKKPLMLHSCLLNTTCYYKAHEAKRSLLCLPSCLTNQSASCHSPQCWANMHHFN